MKWRYLAWAIVAVAVVGFAAVMIPGSPISLQNTIGEPVSEDVPLEDVNKPVDPNVKRPTRPLREWVADLSSPDRAVRLKALYAIDRIAPLSAKATMPVAKLVQADPDPEVKVKASHVLYRIGAEAKPALDIATAALADENPEVRRNAVLYMMTLKKDARPAVPALIKAMNDPRNDVTLGHNETVQVVAASALGGVSAGTPEAVPALTEVASSKRPDLLRAAAARALGMIGDPAKPSVPTLTTLLATPNLDLKEDVTAVLRLLGESPPDVVRPKADYGKGYSAGSGGGPGQYGAVPKDGEGKPDEGKAKKDGGKKGKGEAKADGPGSSGGAAEKAPTPRPKAGG